MLEVLHLTLQLRKIYFTIKKIGLHFTAINRIIYGVGNFEPSNSIDFQFHSRREKN